MVIRYLFIFLILINIGYGMNVSPDILFHEQRNQSPVLALPNLEEANMVIVEEIKSFSMESIPFIDLTEIDKIFNNATKNMTNRSLTWESLEPLSA